MRLGMRPRVLMTAVGVGWAVLSGPGPARAADADAPSQATKQKASQLFARGEALFRIGDYARAAQLFEEANTLAPHPDILWNTARSYEKAGMLAQAANAYAAYLERSPENAPDRREAAVALERVARKVGRLDVHAPRGATVIVDGRALAGESTYLAPGSHSLRATLDERSEPYSVAVEAGEIRSLSVLAPPSEDPGPPPAAPPPAPALPVADVNPGGHTGLSPWFFVGSAALTVAAGGLAAFFAVDTQSARDAFDASPSQARFDEGRDKQLRTNVTIGVAGGLAVLTAVTGIWLVDWSRPSARSAFTLRPGPTGLSGAF